MDKLERPMRNLNIIVMNSNIALMSQKYCCFKSIKQKNLLMNLFFMPNS